MRATEMSEMSEHNVTAKNGAFKIHRAECKITFLPVSRCFDGQVYVNSYT